MALTITYGSSKPVVKIGRMAGQFAKPRSSPVETRLVDGVEVSLPSFEGGNVNNRQAFTNPDPDPNPNQVSLPSYKGDNVNRQAFTAEARAPDPSLMVRAYHQCSQTLNILRAFSKGGYADMARLQAWNLEFVAKSPAASRYRDLAAKVEESLRFMGAIGVNTAGDTFTKVDFYTAHECLLLGYEECLTRQDSLTGQWYGTSAHMLWVGERTRQLDCGHLEFVRGLGNPLGVKISDKCPPGDLLALLDTVNPDNTPGRVTLIIRMGAGKIREGLPPLVRAVQGAGKHVLWISDPVHGNTITAESGHKTRPLAAVVDEIRGFFEVHRALGTHPGGVHLEMTGESVTECLGGSVNEVTNERLDERYTTLCDPRLNAEQALEISFLIAEQFRADLGLPPLCVGDDDAECLGR